MKRLLVLAALAVAGCTGGQQDEKIAGAGPGVVATFTADVDPAAGTLSIRSRVAAPGSANPTGRLVEAGPADVSVANTVVGGEIQRWFNVPQGGPIPSCTDGHPGNVWGANVSITTQASDTILSNVYAQIQRFGGTTGQEACNGVAAPSGITDLGLGLWSTPVMTGGVATQDWVFKYASSVSFSFSGRILASVARQFTYPAYPYGNIGIVDNGTGVVYPDYEAPQLVFLEPDAGTGWTWTASREIEGVADSLVKDPTHDIIWYLAASDLNHVGYVTSGDHGAGGASAPVLDPIPEDTTVVAASVQVDPDPALTRAWFVTSLYHQVDRWWYQAALLHVDVDPGDGSVSAPAFFSLQPGRYQAIAFGSDDDIYATSMSQTLDLRYGWIQRCSKTGCGGSPDVIGMPVACAYPQQIIAGPGGKLWFTAWGELDTGVLCTLDPSDDTVSKVGDVPDPGYLALGPDGVVWVGSSPSTVMRFQEGSPPLSVVTQYDPVYGTVWGLGALWVVAYDGVVRVTP